MLRSLKDFESYTVSATDGQIGKVVDFLLDDERWIVRYMIVDTGGGFLELNGRRVLVSPITFGQPDAITQRFHVALTVDKIKHSPDIDVDKPVSRQHERDYSHYYGFPYYWGYTGIWGMGSYPGFLVPGDGQEISTKNSDDSPGDMHLRSAKEVRRYHIQGTDGAIGHVDDFIVDDETWEVRYLAIDTRDWWFGKKVLIAPQWASSVSWSERRVHVAMSRAQIKDAPEWHAGTPVNREYEERLYDYHGRPIYWPEGSPRIDASRIENHPS
jgi:hypothetical protein